MVISSYTFKVSYDGGTIYLKTTASSLSAARRNILLSEGCPERSLSLHKIRKVA